MLVSSLARPVALVATTALLTFPALVAVAPASAAGAATLTALDTAYSQNFDSLASSGTADFATLPDGWYAVESGSGANTLYTAGTGSGNSGDTYSLGASGSSERALGGLQSGSVKATYGVQLVNSTGSTVTSLDLAYTAEQWRLGGVAREDRIEVEVSTDATSLATGTWSAVPAATAVSPVTTGTAGALDGNAPENRVASTASIEGLTIAPGASAWLRWNDVNAAGSDDALAVDDVLVTAHGAPAGNPSGVGSADPATVVEGGSTTLTVTTTPGSNPVSTGITVAADASSIGGPASLALLDDGNAPDTTAGDGVFTATVSVAPGTSPGAKTVPFTVSDAEARSSSGSIALTTTVLDPCQAADVTIGSVQGSGADVATTGSVTVQGVVVGDYEGSSPSLRGFYLQDSGDGDATTSDGIFVFEGDNLDRVSVGDVVQVTGTAGENQGQSQISSTTGIVSCGTTASVTATPVTLPWSSATAPEAFEGMLVTLDQTAYVTEHFQLGRFGQVVLSSGDRLRQPTNMVAPGAPALALQAENNLNRLILDDATQTQNPDPIVFGRGGQPLSATNTLRGGDTITGVSGVLTYTWGGNSASPNNYRLRPLGSLGGTAPDFQPTNPRPTSAPSVGGDLTAAGMNQLNYFNTFGAGCSLGVGGASTDCRGADSASEFDRQWPKTVAAILKIDAAILGVNEVENDGYGPDSALAHLVDRLNEATAPGTYAFIDADAATGQVNALGTDAIKVGLIYQPGKVTPVGQTAALNTTAFVTGGDSAARNRASLAQAFEEVGTGGRVVVNVNHLKSKGSACDAPDAGDGQGNCNLVRTQAVSELMTWLDSDPTGTGDPDVLLLGDYNSYAMEDPITALEDGGFVHLIKTRLGPAAYSYVFDGQWGYLDHALASSSLDAQVTGVADYHVNADEPSVLDYNTNFKTAGQISGLYAADEFRVSDHDVVMVGLHLAGPPPVATAVTATTSEDTAVEVALSGSGSGPLSYAVASDPTHGTVTVAGATVAYTPEANWSGTDTFTYTVSDGEQTSAPATVTITVNPVDDPATLSLVSGVCLGWVSGMVTVVVTDTDGGPSPSITATSSNTALLPDDGITLGGSATVRTVTVKTAASVSGVAQLTLTATSSGASSHLTLTVRQGTGGADTIIGGAGHDLIFGLAGNDRLEGRGTSDILCGSGGNDTLIGGDGDDMLFGEAGSDLLDGGGGADSLQGGDQNDVLRGANGEDALFGDRGNDRLTGGADADYFDGGAGTDIATDYSSTVDHSITRVP